MDTEEMCRRIAESRRKAADVMNAAGTDKPFKPYTMHGGGRTPPSRITARGTPKKCPLWAIAGRMGAGSAVSDRCFNVCAFFLDDVGACAWVVMARLLLEGKKEGEQSHDTEGPAAMRGVHGEDGDTEV